MSSQSALSNESDSLIWHKEDCLIDGTGQKYLFKEDDTEARNFIKVGTLLSTYEITKLIQAHEFSKAQVCLTKIQFKSVIEAIESLNF